MKTKTKYIRNENIKPESIFKLYSKGEKTNQSDSIFTIVGRKEPALTKSLAYLLSFSEYLLHHVLDLVSKISKEDIEHDYQSALVSAEQLSEDGHCRRDIAILLRYKVEKRNTLIVIEAKNLNRKIQRGENLLNQIEEYFEQGKYKDVLSAPRKVAVSLTKESLKLSSKSKLYNSFVSVTWNEMLELIDKAIENNSNEHNNLLKSFKELAMNSSDLKVYEEEIFCPPVGDTFGKVEELKIYLTLAERSHRKAIFLLPRIPVKRDEKRFMEKMNISDIGKYKGKAFSLSLYKIKESFVTNMNSLNKIEDDDVRKNVEKWIVKSDADWKVFVLGEEMKFKKPKIFKKQNNSWNGYLSLSDIWGDEI